MASFPSLSLSFSPPPLASSWWASGKKRWRSHMMHMHISHSTNQEAEMNKHSTQNCAISHALDVPSTAAKNTLHEKQRGVLVVFKQKQAKVLTNYCRVSVSRKWWLCWLANKCLIKCGELSICIHTLSHTDTHTHTQGTHTAWTAHAA